MAEKNKNNFVVNDKTYVKKPEIHYSYKFQPYVKDLGGSPGKNITQEDRNKRLKHENNVNAVRNLVKGLNNTFGKAISGAAAFYGGGWALNRLLHLNKPSTFGLFFGRYVLPANTADNVSDGVELIFDPSVKGAVDLGSGVVLGRFKDLSKPVRQVGELIGQGANINNMKNGGLIRKMQTAAGGPLQLTPEELKYLEWSKMTPELKREYRNNRINAELQRGPNIKHFWEAFQTYIGNRDPENPNLNIGIINATPGRATPQLILLSAKLMETINKYWKNLGRLKIRLSGGRATSGILTKPGTAPTTFNGLNINYITSPKGGNVTHKFYTDLGSEYILTKDGFARRVKSPHNNTLGQGSGPTEWNAANSDAGLHNWNEGTTIFTEGEDGKLFNTAFYKLSDFGFKPGTYGLARKGEKARIMLIDPKTRLWRAAMLSDVYPTTVKLGLQADRVMETNYSDVPKLGWHILEKANGGWHPGSSVAFIEGLKQGGKMNILEFLKNGSRIHIKEKNKGSFTRWCGGNVTEECIRRGKASSNPKIRKKATFADNARHFKHRLGGSIVKLQLGDYFKWNNLSREDKVKRNKQIAKLYLDKGPSILNYYNALKAYFGGFNPKNPYLITGEAPSPGWGKQGITGLHKMMAKLPETKLVLLAPLAGRSRAASTLKMEDIVKAQLHRDEVYKRWASLYKLLYDSTPTTFRTKPARVRRLETDISKTNGRTLAGGKGHAGGSYNRKSHTINVTTSKTVSAKNLEDIGFHEGIHSYGLGESPSYLWKTKYLNFPEGTNPYSLDPREIATHGIQQGQNLGIKVGQPYPGKEAMIKIIENRPEGLGFGGIPYTLYNNAKTNADYRRLWSLLNGTFKDGGVITVANARKWKHLNGGIIGNILLNGYNLFLQDSSLNKSLDNYKKGLEFNKKVLLNNISTKNYMDKALQSENELLQLNPDYNVSPLVVLKKAYDMANQERASLLNLILMLNAYDLALYTDLINLKKLLNYMNFVNSVIGGLKNKLATSV